jgi:hypothetical protein
VVGYLNGFHFMSRACLEIMGFKNVLQLQIFNVLFFFLFGFSFVSKLKLVKFPILSLREDVKIVRVLLVLDS